MIITFTAPGLDNTIYQLVFKMSDNQISLKIEQFKNYWFFSMLLTALLEYFITVMYGRVS